MGHELEEYPSIALKPEDLTGPLDLAQLFGRPGPVHIEIGSGRGTFLLHAAQAQPEVNFLGIEWARKFYLHAVDRIGRWGLTNVRIIRTDAATFLAESVPPGSVTCLHIYFPDPWPKKRHHKRRLVQADNMPILIRCLEPGGQIRLATDHTDYFEQMKAVAAASRSALEPMEFVRPAGAAEGELTGTNYERKYIKDGRPIYILALRKRRDPLSDATERRPPGQSTED
jgi:tRNA (guanine-N7-)-methyltransferase